MDEAIGMSVWVLRGKMMIRRDALDTDDPDYPYNYIASLGRRPEEYGYERPPSLCICPKCGHRFSEGAEIP